MNNKPKITEVNKFFFVFVVLYLFFQIILAIVINVLAFTYGQYYINNFYQKNFYVITLISEYGIILLPVLLYVIVKKLPIKSVFKIKSPGIVPLIIIILSAIPAYAVALMLNSIVIYLIQFIGPIPQSAIPIPQNLLEFLFSLFVIAVTPAICEEIMHRGLFLDAYERRGSYRAVFLTAFLFAIFHFDITNFIGPFFLGLIIGFYVLRTNSIFSGIVAHFLNNAIALTIQYLSRNQYIPQGEATAIGLDDLFVVMLIGIAGIIILSGLFPLFKSATRGRAVVYKPISSIGNYLVSVLSHWPIIVIIAVYLLMSIFTFLAIYITGIVH